MTILENNSLRGLTGRRRYRDTQHGLILQVEQYYWNATRWECDWYDAAVSDVMAFELA
jgi:hypothetical protein